MAIIRNIVYPHVGITTNAAVRKSTPADESTATTLFAPFVAKKGPENVGVKIYSNSEFISTFGALDYSEQGQQVLNIGNWLNNGGAVLACRMTASPSDWIKPKPKEFSVYFVENVLYINGNRTDIMFNNSISGLNAPDVNMSADSELPDNRLQLRDLFDTEKKFTVTLNEDSNSGDTYDKLEISDALHVISYEDTGEVKYLSIDGYKNINSEDWYLVSEVLITVGGNPFNIKDSYNMKSYCMCRNTNGKIDGVIQAKYSGAYYNDMKVRVQKQTDSLFKITVYVGEVQVESFSRRKWHEIKTLDKYSDYIGYINLGPSFEEYFKDAAKNATIDYDNFSGGVDTKYDEALIANAIESALGDKLSVKCDLILDAGYKAATKQAIAEKIASLDDNKRVRDDLIFISDMYELDYKNNVIPKPSDGLDGHDGTYEARCLAVYDQYGTTEDIYSENSGVEVYVTPTYFLAGLIPYNDAHYGIGYPTAGKRRGVIEDALSINHNPTTAEKNEYYEQRINYIEKDSRSIQFMSQSTWTEENTALQYLNNSRVVNKIVTDIEALGRDYLFEYNDTTTLNNLKNAITKYMNNWVLSRTLSKCIVSVEPGEDDKTVAVRLDIAFTGIIEVISIEINIE